MSFCHRDHCHDWCKFRFWCKCPRTTNSWIDFDYKGTSSFMSFALLAFNLIETFHEIWMMTLHFQKLKFWFNSDFEETLTFRWHWIRCWRKRKKKTKSNVKCNSINLIRMSQKNCDIWIWKTHLDNTQGRFHLCWGWHWPKQC